MCVRPCDNYLISLYSIGFNKILCKVRFPILDIIVVKGAYNRNTYKLGVIKPIFKNMVTISYSSSNVIYMTKYFTRHFIHKKYYLGSFWHKVSLENVMALILHRTFLGAFSKGSFQELLPTNAPFKNSIL